MKVVKCPTCHRESEMKENSIFKLCPICQEEMEEFIDVYERRNNTFRY